MVISIILFVICVLMLIAHFREIKSTHGKG
jgi:hypothetical protein